MIKHKKKCSMIAAALLGIACVFGAAACAPTPAAETNDPGIAAEENGEKTEAIAVEWTPDSDCSLCHIAEGDSLSQSTAAASLHASSSCVDCHDDADTLAMVHDGKTTEDLAPKRLKKTKVADEGCLTCHAREELKTATADSQVLVDVNGKVVNQHDLPAVDSHGEIVCSDCHKLHGDTAEVQEDAQQLCQSCHHAGVFECYTCHEHD